MCGFSDARVAFPAVAQGAALQTIIETLKYITTQSLPPGKSEFPCEVFCAAHTNDSTGVSKADWLHDPKVARQPTVSALIKLRFRDQTGVIKESSPGGLCGVNSHSGYRSFVDCHTTYGSEANRQDQDVQRNFG